MNLTVLLDVAIGLALVYLGASLFVTIINEYIAQIFRLRSKQVCDSIQKLIMDGTAETALKSNPALAPFFTTARSNWFRFWEPDGRRSAPSYADPKVVAQTLVGALAVGATAADTVARFREEAGKLPDPLKTQLLALANTAQDKAENLVEAVGTWFDKSLTMLGEGYKSRLQIISFIVGLAVAVAANLDTTRIVSRLYRDKEARDATVAVAVELTERTDSTVFSNCLGFTPAQREADSTCAPMRGLVAAVQQRNASLGKLPIGWDEVPGSSGEWLDAALHSWPGWFLTALALSLGAPFWFDTLNKFVNIRHGLKRPEEPEKQS